jgi:hypothetical protein
MGTHALVVFEADGVRHLVIYIHWDGYLAGVGAELADFLSKCMIVNGISSRDQDKCKAEGLRLCNGFGAVVAQYLKHGTSSEYVMPTDTKIEAEFNYTVSFETESKTLSVVVNNSTPMSLAAFAKFCLDESESDEGEEEVLERKQEVGKSDDS